jgi:GH25 family lysozyme M1 (1,4-beta-N-acetylmuramidase)
MKINLVLSIIIQALKNEIEKKQEDIIRIREESMMQENIDNSHYQPQRNASKKVENGINFNTYTAQIDRDKSHNASMSFLKCTIVDYKVQKTII